MGLVKMGWRRGRSPRPTRLCGSVANVGVLPVPMLPISNWGLELAGYGAGRIGLVYYSAKGKLRWQRNADIAIRRATGMDARTAVTFCLVVRKQGELRRKDILLCHLRA